MILPPQPSRETDISSQPWQKWFSLIRDAINVSSSTSVATTEAAAAQITSAIQYASQDFMHDELSGLNDGEFLHLSNTEYSGLTGLSPTELHQHDFDFVTFPVGNYIGTPDHIYTLQELMDHEWSAGVVDGCALTDNGDGTVSIAAGVGVIRGEANGHTTLYGVTIAEQLNIAITNDATNYIYLDYNAGAPIFSVSTSLTSFNCMDKCIAYMVHRLGTVINYVDAREQNVDSNRKIRQMFLKFSRFIHSSDGTTIGSNGLALTLTAGSFFFMLQEITHVAFDTSVAGTANENVFTLWTVAGSTWTATASSKVINTTLYNDTATGTVTLGNNNFGVSWVYLINNNPSELHVVMGQAEYPNIASARVASPPILVPTIVSGLGALVGFVIYEKSVITFDNVYSAFTQAFTPGLATTHNGLSGLQGGTVGEYYHLTSAQATDLTDGGQTTLHSHSASPTSNIISVPTTIPADNSYVVISYLQVDSDLTINGNLMVIG